jgi:hypothetical protein
MESKKEITAVDYDRLLVYFLSGDDRRPAMQQANTVGDKTYATDGTALIVIPNSYLRNGYPAHVKTPNYQSVLDQVKECAPVIFKDTDLFKVLKVHPKEYDQSPCEECEGDGKCPHCRKECDDCNGTGYVEDTRLPMVYSREATIQILEQRFLPYRLTALEKVVVETLSETFSVVGVSGACTLFAIGEIRVLIAHANHDETEKRKFPNTVLTTLTLQYI